MYKKFLLSVIFIGTSYLTLAQNKPSYRLYDKNGKKVSYQKLVRNVLKSDIVLFGEFHNNPVSHWLQLELTKEVYNEKPLTLGAEMFEADNQKFLDQYIRGEIDFNAFDSLARLWKNYKTDYAPLVEFAKEHQLTFIASNIPRRYASSVSKNGGFGALDSLGMEDKSWIAPLPVPFDAELSQYKKMLTMAGSHGSPDMIQAQAVKDATMAHFILANYRKGSLFLHFNGAFHSDFHQGIVWYLQRYNANVKIITISTVEQTDLGKLEKENRKRADFIICVDSDMTKTF